MSNFQPDPVVRGTGAPLMECLPILKSGNEKISAPTVDVHLERVALEVLRDAFTTTFQSPEVTAVKRASDLQTQQFFKQHELDLQNGFAQKPMFFSSSLQQIVVSEPDLRSFLRQYEEAWQSRPDSVVSSLKAFAVNRIEFALHEIGHIAAYNKSIVVRESAVPELKKMRADLENMLNVWPNPEIGRERIPHVLSDLRAEVFRRFCSLDNEAGRDQSSFSSIGVQERVFEGGVLRCPTIYPDSILRMLAWYPVCKALGPEGSPEKVMSSATKAARSYHSSLTSLVPLAAEYFDLYFTSRCYDKQRLLSRLGGEY